MQEHDCDLIYELQSVIALWWQEVLILPDVRLD